MPERRDIAVIGLGTFGTAVAKELTRIGDNVTGIDRDTARITKLDGKIDSVVQADATDIKVLRHIGVENFDSVIVAIGEDMQSSLLTILGLNEAGCETVYVKAQTPEHARILKAMGVSNLLEPEQSFATRLSHYLHNPKVLDYLELGGSHVVATLGAPIGGAFRTADEIPLGAHNLTCVGIDTGERIIIGRLSDHVLSVTDRLIVIGDRADINRFAKVG